MLIRAVSYDSYPPAEWTICLAHVARQDAGIARAAAPLANAQPRGSRVEVCSPNSSKSKRAKLQEVASLTVNLHSRKLAEPCNPV